MAELSTGVVFSTDAPWRLALDALRGYIERLITSPLINALTLADIDLALQRIERIEKTAMSALRSYFGYINA